MRVFRLVAAFVAVALIVVILSIIAVRLLVLMAVFTPLILVPSVIAPLIFEIIFFGKARAMLTVGRLTFSLGLVGELVRHIAIVSVTITRVELRLLPSVST